MILFDTKRALLKRLRNIRLEAKGLFKKNSIQNKSSSFHFIHWRNMKKNKKKCNFN